MSCRCSSEHEPDFCSDGSLHSYASWIHDGARSKKCRHVLNIGNYPYCVRAECIYWVKLCEGFHMIVWSEKHVSHCPLLHKAQRNVQLMNCTQNVTLGLIVILLLFQRNIEYVSMLSCLSVSKYSIQNFNPLTHSVKTPEIECAWCCICLFPHKYSGYKKCTHPC